MGYIKSLGYVGISAGDLDAWRDFGTRVLGLQTSEVPQEGEDDTVYLRMDGRCFRLAVHGGADGGLEYLGFEVSTREQLDEFSAHLRAQGLDVTDEGPELCTRRRVAAMRSTADPEGNRLEFFVGHEEATAPFVSPTGARFVIGDMGIGHVFFTCTDIEKFKDFYITKLGFRLSDTVSLTPATETQFLHCNSRHHTIASVALPGREPVLHHIMFQVDSLDTVGYAYDRGGDAIELSLGKHTNDHMVSCFFKAPSGLSIEYGIDGRLVDDDTWVVGHYTAASYWGHTRPGAAAGGS